MVSFLLLFYRSHIMFNKVNTHSRSTLSILAAVFISSTAAVVTAAPAQNPKIPSPLSIKSAIIDIAPGKNGQRAISLDFDVTPVSRGRALLSFDLPGHLSAIFKKDFFEDRGNGNAVWRGQLYGSNNGTAVITVHKGLAFGRIQIGQNVYEVRPGKGRNHIIELLDLTTFPETYDDVAEDMDLQADTSDSTILGDGITTNTGTVEIDLMSVYTPEGRDEVGGTAQMEVLIQSAIDNANAAFAASDMNLVYRLVHTVEINHTESGILSNERSWLKDDPTVAALRDQYGADMVGMVTRKSDSGCGTGSRTGTAETAFQATSHHCAVGNLSYAHEHGHNLTMEHDPVWGSDTPLYEWSYGHYVNGSYRTIMSYSRECSSGCVRVMHHSNPDIIHNGVPTGTSLRDNARTGDLFGPIASNYRVAYDLNVLANSDSYFTEINTPLSGNVLSNDTDPEGDPITVIGNTSPAHGNVGTVASDGNFTYTPDTNFIGDDSFNYTISDGNGNDDSTTVNITVEAANRLPQAVDDNYATYNNTPVTGNVLSNDTDPDGNALTMTLWSGNPVGGTVAIDSNGDFTYTPDSDFVGVSSFTYTADDGRNGSDEGLVTITVSDAGQTASVDVQISGSWDDVEEGVADGTIYDQSSDIELGDDPNNNGEQTGGLRFQNINVPQGATIQSAYIEFETDEVDSGATSVTFWAENSDNASPFTATNYNLTDRVITNTSVDWNDIPAWNTVSERHFSPNLHSIVQEVVDRTGWIANNSIVFVIRGTGSRTAEAYDGESSNAASLHIVYSTSSTVNFAPIASFTFNSTDLITSFTDASTDNDGSIVSQAWSFGDGSTSSLTNPSHTYTSSGSYSVTLTVTDNDGATGTITKTVTVSDGNTTTPLGTPSNLTASIQTSGKGKTKIKTVTLNWSDNASEETEFVIERCEETGRGGNKACVFNQLTTVTANTTTFVDAGISGTYKYRVKARNADGDSGYSNEVKI